MYETIEQRLHRVLEVHFNPQTGSKFWLGRAAQLGIDPVNEIYAVDDLNRFGILTADELQRTPLLDIIPQSIAVDPTQLVIGQTGGATGPGTWTAYCREEFEQAFITPFASAAKHVNFPRGEQWLFVGPTGPHIIGKAASLLANSAASPEPFTVDFDPRWARKLTEGSLSRSRYTSHIVDQAMAVIDTQEIGVLFATPPILHALADRMTQPQRDRIRGVHYGGMRIDPQSLYKLQSESFAHAVHLSGYGNTLTGCCLEISVDAERAATYFPYGNRLLFSLLDEDDQPIAEGQTGRVHVTRLDVTMLLINLQERDEAAIAQPPTDAPLGYELPGLIDPKPYEAGPAPVVAGLY